MNHPFLQKIKNEAKKNPSPIIFAEGKEKRVKAAAKIIEKEGLAVPILLEDTQSHPQFENMLKLYKKMRNTSEEAAYKATSDPHVLSALLVKSGEAKAMISGPSASSKERILPALQIIRSKHENHKASSYFIMLLPETVNVDAANGGVLFFADCAVNVSPSVQELANIAIDTADSAQSLGLQAKVAMLTFSTEGSSLHPAVKKVRKAASLIHKKRSDLQVSNDMQADAALIDSIGECKAHENKIAGHANVLIFPSLEAGNIAYKLVERLCGAKVIGPVLQGLNKTVAELSRGSDEADIVNLAALISVLTSKQ